MCMRTINVISILILIIIIAYETYLILKRNKTVLIKGNDDFFLVMVLLLIVLLVFPFNQNELVEEAVRNLLTIVAIVASLSIKRGINNQGIVKVCFIIYWNQISHIIVEENKSSSSKAIFSFYLKSGFISKWKLQFNLKNIEPALDMCAKHVSDIKINPDFYQKIQKYKNYF